MWVDKIVKLINKKNKKLYIEVNYMEEYSNFTFQQMRNDIQKHFAEEMSQYKLFKVDVDVEELWHTYLDAYPAEMQTNYKEARWQDCTSCHRWFKKMSNVVALDDNGNMITIFSCHTLPQYQNILNQLADMITGAEITEVFLSSAKEIGHKTTYTEDEFGNVQRNDHFYSVLPDKVIREGIQVGRSKDKYHTARELLERSLSEITIEALDIVVDLINDNNLYRGDVWKTQITKFRSLKIAYENTDNDIRNNWLWLKSMEAGIFISGIKNHSIGVLLKDLSNDVDLEIALQRYEHVVAPANYQRPKAIFTKKMLEDAKAKITELGYLESLPRRYAIMQDVSINDVLFANRNLSTNLKDNDLFAELEKDAVVKHKTFDYTEAINIQDFIEKVLPEAQEVSLYAETVLANNFVSLIAPVNADAPSMFKWDNPFSWAYRNNVADSMKEQVKALGGDVDVDLRFSIRWNNGLVWDKNDLDAHCTTPDSEEIYYSHMRSRKTGGWLDVDIIDPKEDKPAVENIQFKNRAEMLPGEYLFRVHQFSYRGGDEGFEAEIEFDGNIYNFNYPYKIRQDDYIDVAKVIVHENGDFELVNLLDGMVSNRLIWNVKMNEFIPVTFICYSPNYWGDNEIGNQHIFFMLKDCQNDSRPNAWFNEYLNNELHEHRKVMEALGTKAKVEESNDQLSGVGFSLTQHSLFKVKVLANNTEKIYQIFV